MRQNCCGHRKDNWLPSYFNISQKWIGYDQTYRRNWWGLREELLTGGVGEAYRRNWWGLWWGIGEALWEELVRIIGRNCITVGQALGLLNNSYNLFIFVLIWQLLLNLGASPNSKDLRGLTALYYNIQKGGDPMTAEVLMKERTVLNVSDNQGWKEIHHVSITFWDQLYRRGVRGKFQSKQHFSVQNTGQDLSH